MYPERPLILFADLIFQSFRNKHKRLTLGKLLSNDRRAEGFGSDQLVLRVASIRGRGGRAGREGVQIARLEEAGRGCQEGEVTEGFQTFKTENHPSHPKIVSS